MKLEKVIVFIGRKISDRNYGSFDRNVGVEVSVEEGEKFAEVYTKVSIQLKSVIDAEIKELEANIC